MRVTARKLLNAALAGKSRKVGNSSVEVNPDRSVIFRLHGNAILDISPEGEVSCSLAGWPTPTTRSRVNDFLAGLGCSARVGQERGRQWLHDHGRPVSDISSTEWYLVGKLSPADLKRLRTA